MKRSLDICLDIRNSRLSPGFGKTITTNSTGNKSELADENGGSIVREVGTASPSIVMLGAMTPVFA